MTPSDAARLLAFIGGLDPTLNPADPTDLAAMASAWAETVVDQIDLGFARSAAVAHYGKTSESLTPSRLNAAWGEHQRSTELARFHDSPAHCERSDCDCSHSAGCFKGWLDSDEPGPVKPCPRCRPWTAARLRAVPPPGRRNQADEYRLRGEGVDRSALDLAVNETTTTTERHWTDR